VMLALAGVAAGCLLAGLSAKVFAHLVWGVSTTDPGTYAGVAAGLLLIAALASLLPALRIARLNPADTLREE
jgi:putative ABC transport system permease protein